MAGAANSCLGIEFGGIIKTYLTQIKYPHVLAEKGPAVLNAVLIKLGKDGKAVSIKPIHEATMIQ